MYSRGRKSTSDNKETVRFQCLHCRKSTARFDGHRNKTTGSLHCAGLLKHIRTKKTDNALLCQSFYTELWTQNGGVDITSSVMETGSISDSHSDSSILEMDLSGFEEAVLPKSNSMKPHSKFRKNPFHNSRLSFQIPKVNHSKMDNLTYPSKKLLPAISYDAILDFAKTMARLKPKSEKVRQRQAEGEETLGFTLIRYDDLEEEEEEEQEEEEEDYYDSEELEDREEGDGDSDGDSEGNQDDGEEVMIVPLANPPEPSDLINRQSQEEDERQDPSQQLPTQMVMHQELLRLQEKHKMSFAAFDDILKWAQQAERLQPGIFREKFPPRQTMINQYRDLLGLRPDAYKFKETIIREWLPDKKPCVIRRRPFLDCVYELLTKESLLGEKSKNISLPHPSDPFAEGPEPTIISEVHHGDWWSKTKRKLCTGPRDVLCPLAFEVDETYLDTNGRLTVCPFNIRLLIFNVAACKSVDASTTWFFLPNDDAEAAHHEAKTEAVHKVQNLHNAMRECFKDLKYMMDNNIGMEWKLWYGGEEHDVVLKFALAFVVSDTAMHDKLCCHYGTRNMNIKAICRHCDCPTVELSSFKTFLKCKSWIQLFRPP